MNASEWTTSTNSTDLQEKNHTHMKFLTFTRDKFLRMPLNHKKMRILTIWRKWFLRMPHISRKIYILPFCKNKKFLAKQSNQPEKLHYIFFVWICLRNCNKLSTKKFCSTKQPIYEYFTPYLQIFHFFPPLKFSQSQQINKNMSLYTLPGHFSFG